MSLKSQVVQEKNRLSAGDWQQAALDALSEAGLQGIAIEMLARRLGVTKGSFYWHFESRDALIQAALELWESQEQELVFGKLDKPALMHLPDMTPRELATLAPLIVLTIFFGAYPAPILDLFGPSVESIIKPLNEAAAAAHALATASLQ